ncbi:MAG: hypothetical protein KUL83_10320 [Lentimicrobium sp.]|jgi:hypothetical protein|nr:hypothetical protein [Lentimicrobium sp.]MDD2528118.1 hypothetical protein [Lentimicrobiaceae bacterium]MDD4596750.1 hypothetical protein [Lentimicrobiaceae bacterium]MDY0024492.1 hypothetical protein [Lentimicrobium sp.]
MPKHEKWIAKFKPAVSKRVLCFTGAALWAFASYRVLKITFRALSLTSVPAWIVVTSGLLGLYIFFSLVFKKVTKRNVTRIYSLKSEKPCIFAFIGWKTYLIIFFMIGLSILFERFKLMPAWVEGIFFIALGGSLLLSAIILLFAGFSTRPPTNKKPDF